MKTFNEIRNDIISDITRCEMLGADNQYTYAKIEELAAKEYAKQWVERVLLEQPSSLVQYYLKQIDAQ